MKYVKILIALLVIVGAAYWAYDSVRIREFAGSPLALTAGNDNLVSLSHAGEDPATLLMSSNNTFSVSSSDTTLSGNSTREGSGRNVVHSYQVELPPGTVDFRVTRGSNVNFSLEAESAEAVLTPMNSEAARNTILVAVVIILAALYYTSRILEHRWLKALALRLRPKVQPSAPQPPATATGS